MTVHRKSNWYIYLLAFGITTAFVIMAIVAFKWYLFPDNTQEVNGGNNGELTDDFRPTKEHSFNLIAMLSDAEADPPELFTLIEYNAVENRMIFVPLPVGISVAKEERDLSSIYTALGGEGVVSAVENAVGVRCGCYVKMDRSSFCEFATALGGIEYTIRKTIIVKDGAVTDTFNAGSSFINSESIFRLMMIADFQEGEAFRYNIVGELLTEMLNQNYHNIDSSTMDILYRLIMENSETNLTETLFRAHKAAMLNTVEYGSNPGEYYIPYGEYTDGAFKISDNSVLSIQQKAGMG